MKAKPLPDQSALLQCLIYDPDSGELTWKVRPESSFLSREHRTPAHMANAWNANWAGKPAFTTVAKNGYLTGIINGRKLYAHRVIYVMVYGVEPEDIDHEDGNRQNNRIQNLVSKTRGGNLRNRRLSSNNTSGYHGVSFSRRHKLWSVVIYDDKKPIHLGWFRGKDDAIAARKAAEIKYGYHPNHGLPTNMIQPDCPVPARR